MSKWILVGPFVGLALVAVALLVGYVVVPPVIVQKVTEVCKINATIKYKLEILRRIVGVSSCLFKCLTFF